MLLTAEDLAAEKIDLAEAKNLTPFQCLLKLAPVALQKLLRQETLEREKHLKRPMVLPTKPRIQALHDQEEEGCRRGKRKPAASPSSSKKRSKGKAEEDCFVGFENAKISERFRRFIETEMKGSDIKLMIQKKLTATDLKPNEGRLSIPVKRANRGVLKEEEEKYLCTRQRKSDPVPVMEAKMVGPELGVGKIVLKLWEMRKVNGTSYIYVLARHWNDVVREQGLMVEDVIQVWGFRMEGDELGIALVRLKKENAAAAGEGCSNAGGGGGGEGSNNGGGSSGEGSNNDRSSGSGGEGSNNGSGTMDSTYI